jgi:uncharacterized protein
MTRIVGSEMHRFQVNQRHYAFLVPSSAVLELDGAARSILDALDAGPAVAEQLASTPAIREALHELAQVGAVQREGDELPVPIQVSAVAPVPPPVTTIVLNVTNSCNLSCRYCYEYGEDRLAPRETPAIMTEETARQAVDLLMSQSPPKARLQVTFFGGETLINWKVVRPTVEHARRVAQAQGKFVDFSLTTNGTLLTDEICDWLARNHIGVTVSIDGPKSSTDAMRVYADGRGIYDVIAPRIKKLLSVHRSRPIGARVTVTSATLDLRPIYRHLVEELGFYEVGFAPVTTAPGRDYAIGEAGFDRLLDQFRELADDYVKAALGNRHFGFANLSDLLGEIHQGVAKAYPCGAGIGLLGVAPGGELGLCHRFAGSGDHDFGHVTHGIDQAKRSTHLERGRVDQRIDCRTCWVRSLCAGGCYHEAQVRFGDRFRPNLHMCDWIRSWTALGLEAYGAILEGNPAFLHRFEERKAA